MIFLKFCFDLFNSFMAVSNGFQDSMTSNSDSRHQRKASFTVEDVNLLKCPEHSLRMKRLFFFIAACSNVSLGISHSLYGPFFPREAETKGMTSTYIGLAVGSYNLAALLFTPFFGVFIRYTDSKFLLNSGVFVTGVSSICFGLLEMVSDPLLFTILAFVIRITEGIGAAAMKIAYYSLIATLFNMKMGTIFAFLETFLCIGFVIGPTIGGALYDYGGFRLPFFVMGGLVLLDSLIMLLLLPNIECRNNTGQGNWIKLLLDPGNALYAFAMLTSCIYIGYNQVTLEPHIRQFGLTGFELGIVFAVNRTVIAITVPFWGWLCDKQIDNKLVCMLGCCILAVSLLFIGPMPFLNIESHLYLTVIALALFGISEGAKLIPAFSGCMRDTVRRGFPADITTYGLVSSLFSASNSLGLFVGPTLGGFLLDTIGYDSGTAVLLAMECILIFSMVMYTITQKCLLTSTSEETKPIIGIDEKLHHKTYNS